MKLIDPHDIEEGQYYLQDMGIIKLVKRKINKSGRDENELWGIYIKSDNILFKPGDEGYILMSNPDCRFYLLTDTEIGELFLEKL